jgi:hypothetical protein
LMGGPIFQRSNRILILPPPMWRKNRNEVTRF